MCAKTSPVIVDDELASFHCAFDGEEAGAFLCGCDVLQSRQIEDNSVSQGDR